MKKIVKVAVVALILLYGLAMICAEAKQERVVFIAFSPRLTQMETVAVAQKVKEVLPGADAEFTLRVEEVQPGVKTVDVVIVQQEKVLMGTGAGLSSFEAALAAVERAKAE